MFVCARACVRVCVSVLMSLPYGALGWSAIISWTYSLISIKLKLTMLAQRVVKGPNRGSCFIEFTKRVEEKR